MNQFLKPAATFNCPVDACQMLRHQHHLVCIAHWRKLPKAQQRDVTRAWQAYRANTSTLEALALLAAWRRASAKAIAWLSAPVAGAA